jgi:hypothetical protein
MLLILYLGRLNELGEVEYYPFGEVEMHRQRASGGSYAD